MNPTHVLSNRFALAAVLAAGGLAACGESVPTDPVAAAASLDAGPTSRALRAAPEILRGQATVRRVTAAYHDVTAAEADGFVALTGCDELPGESAQGIHYGLPGRIDGTVELREPEIVPYEPWKNGQLRLVGVEYIVPIALWEGTSPPTLLGQEFHRNDALGLYALHVWAWRHNPTGMFATWNPEVTCAFADP